MMSKSPQLLQLILSAKDSVSWYKEHRHDQPNSSSPAFARCFSTVPLSHVSSNPPHLGEYNLCAFTLHNLIDDDQGVGQMGLASSPTARVSDPAIAQEFVDYMISQGQVGLDTSRIYCDGTSEQVRDMPWVLRTRSQFPYQLLGNLDSRGAACVDTKAFPQSITVILRE